MSIIERMTPSVLASLDMSGGDPDSGRIAHHLQRSD
jgi:hypothetical protein